MGTFLLLPPVFFFFLKCLFSWKESGCPHILHHLSLSLPFFLSPNSHVNSRTMNSRKTPWSSSGFTSWWTRHAGSGRNSSRWRRARNMALKVRNALFISYHCQHLFGTKNVLYFVTQISAFCFWFVWKSVLVALLFVTLMDLLDWALIVIKIKGPPKAHCEQTSAYRFCVLYSQLWRRRFTPHLISCLRYTRHDVGVQS